MGRFILTFLLSIFLVAAYALADNYSGGGGGGGGGGVTSFSTTCPTSGPSTGAVTLFNTITTNAKSASYGPFATDCGQAFIFTLAGAATYSLPAPSAGFYLAAVTNVPTSSNALVISPASGSICTSTCTATYSLAAGATIALYSDGTNYYVQAGASSAPLGPGYGTTNWYIGWYNTNAEAAGGAIAVSTTYCTPTYFANINANIGVNGGGTGTIGTIAIDITTLGTSNVQVALYNNDAATMRPGTLIANTVSIVNTTTGVKTATLTSASVGQGLYWFCAQTGDATVRWATSSNSMMAFTAGNGANTNWYGNVSSGVSTPGTFGTWPDLSASTWTMAGSSTVPIISFQFSSIP